MFSCSLYFQVDDPLWLFPILAAISCGPRLMERVHQRRKGFNREEHLGVQDEYNTIQYVQVVP